MPEPPIKKRRGNLGRNRALTPEKEAEMVAAYFAGEKDVRQIATEFGVSHQTLYNAVDRAPERVRRARRAS